MGLRLAAFVRQMFAWVAAHPRTVGLVYFNKGWSGGGGTFELRTKPRSLAAYRRRLARAALRRLADPRQRPQTLDFLGRELAPPARGEPAHVRGRRSFCGAAGGPGGRRPRTCASTWCFRPSCRVSSIREGPSGEPAQERCGRPPAPRPPRGARAPRPAAPPPPRPRTLLDAVARMGEPVRERTVVRQQEHAGRVGVEASHRHDSRLVPDKVDDGRAAVGSRAV